MQSDKMQPDKRQPRQRDDPSKMQPRRTRSHDETRRRKEVYFGRPSCFRAFVVAFDAFRDL